MSRVLEGRGVPCGLRSAAKCSVWVNSRQGGKDSVWESRREYLTLKECRTQRYTTPYSLASVSTLAEHSHK